MGNERKRDVLLAKCFYRSCEHRIPYVQQRETLRQKGFFPKKNTFDIFFCFWMKKFRICGTFQQGCQNQNPRDQRNFLLKVYLEEDTTLCLLMIFLGKIWFAKNSMFVSKAFFVSSGTFCGSNFLEKQNFSNFWALSENLLGFWPKKFGKVAKTTFHVARATFGLNSTFFQKKLHF